MEFIKKEDLAKKFNSDGKIDKILVPEEKAHEVID